MIVMITVTKRVKERPYNREQENKRQRGRLREIVGQECGGRGRLCGRKRERGAQKRQQKGAKVSVGGKGGMGRMDLSWGY